MAKKKKGLPHAKPIAAKSRSVERTVIIHPDCDIRPLVKATVERAQEEAQHGNDEAREWLYFDGAEWLDMAFDIHPDHTRRWIERECKPKARVATTTPALKPLCAWALRNAEGIV